MKLQEASSDLDSTHKSLHVFRQRLGRNRYTFCPYPPIAEPMRPSATDMHPQASRVPEPVLHCQLSCISRRHACVTRADHDFLRVVLSELLSELDMPQNLPNITQNAQRPAPVRGAEWRAMHEWRLGDCRRVSYPLARRLLAHVTFGVWGSVTASRRLGLHTGRVCCHSHSGSRFGVCL